MMNKPGNQENQLIGTKLLDLILPAFLLTFSVAVRVWLLSMLGSAWPFQSPYNKMLVSVGFLDLQVDSDRMLWSKEQKGTER